MTAAQLIKILTDAPADAEVSLSIMHHLHYIRSVVLFPSGRTVPAAVYIHPGGPPYGSEAARIYNIEKES